jgi:hypothetical protein
MALWLLACFRGEVLGQTSSLVMVLIVDEFNYVPDAQIVPCTCNYI